MGIMPKYQIEKIDKFNRYKIFSLWLTIEWVGGNSKEALKIEPFAKQGD